jgi:hypothetical protein
MEDHHATTVSKKAASDREYTVAIPRDENMGSRFWTCICSFPKKEGIPYKHMVAIAKVGAINELTRIGIMPHWYTTTQWRNQIPEYATFNTHITLKMIKASSTPQDDIRYCPTWAAPEKKGHPKKEMRRKSLVGHMERLARKKHRTK